MRKSKETGLNPANGPRVAPPLGLVIFSLMAKTILLTGGTGFLGSHLLKRLSTEGAEVVLLKRVSSNTRRIADLLPGTTCYNIDETPLEHVFSKHSFDIILHCATNYGRSQLAVTDILQANLLLPLHLLQLADKFNVRAFINTDTILDKRVSAYSLSKKQFSEWFEFFSERILCINVAIEHFYGPGDDPSKFVSSMIARLLADEAEIQLSPGTQKRDFIFIDDVIEAFVKILKFCETAKSGIHRFEVGSGENVSILDLLKMLQKLSGNSSSKLQFGALPFRKNEVMESNVNLTALRALDWKPQFPLAVGLERTITAEKMRLKS